MERLRRNASPDRRSGVAVVGVGQELRGDDGAGVAVARALQALASGRANQEGRTQSPPLLVIDAGPAPENCSGPLRRFRPGLVLLVDAAQMDAAPGTVRWLPWQETSGLSASTHTLPPHLLLNYLTAELGCEAALLGIQPTGTTIAAPLSPPVRRAVEGVVRALAEALECQYNHS